MIKFLIIVILNFLFATLIALINENSFKTRLQKLSFYFTYYCFCFLIAYKYTKYVRKEVFVIPMWIIWISALICATVFFSKNKIFGIVELDNKLLWGILDHVFFVVIEALLLSTQKREYEYLPVALVCITNACLFTSIILFYKFRLVSQKRNIVLSDISFMFCVGAIYEYLNSIVYHSELSIMAMFIDFFVIMLLFFCTLNVNLSIILYSFINLIWILVHYFVSEFRSPLVPSDFYATKTALDVAAQYTLYTNKQIWELLIFTIVVVMICVYGKKIALIGNGLLKNSVRVVGSVALIAFGLCWFNSDFINNYNLYFEEFGIDTIANTYNKVGPTLGFIEVLKKTRVDKPEGYSKNSINNLIQQYQSSSEGDDIKPNIIVIMNETFADLGDLGALNRTEDEYMPYYNSLKSDGKRVAVGRTLVSTFGGDTSKSEYEFLSGSSLAMEPGINPYLTEISFNFNTLVTTLKDQGYFTVATHPCAATNWNREKVYKYMDFDSMLFIDEYDSPKTLRNWVVDEEVYDKVNQLMISKENGDPLFVFGVTVQNHGGFSVDKLSEDEKYLGQDELDLYLNLVSISDESLKKMIDYIDSYEEPTVLLFFGDHYPRLSNSTLDSITDMNSFGEIELAQTKYMTPYLVYSNYDMDMQKFDSLTSLNYLGADLLAAAGLKTTPYENMICDLQTIIPAINAFGYANQDGEFCEFTEMTEEERQRLNNYFILEYDLLYGSHVGEAFRISDD